MDPISVVVSGGPTIEGTAPGVSGLWVESITRPAKRWQRTYARSPFLHGAVQTQATLETSEIVLTIGARDVGSAELAFLKDTVDDAFAQWFYTVAITEDFITTTYECDCADVSWNAFEHGMAGAFIARAVVSIPCYPLFT